MTRIFKTSPVTIALADRLDCLNPRFPLSLKGEAPRGKPRGILPKENKGVALVETIEQPAERHGRSQRKQGWEMKKNRLSATS
jgi:hypothetical protein